MREIRLHNTPARISVDHETRYDYAEPVEIAHHLAFLRPTEDAAQRVEHHELTIDPPAASHHASIDTWGNRRSFFTHSSPHRHLSVRARSIVRLDPRVLDEDLHDSLPWEAVTQRLAFRAGHAPDAASEFGVPSPMIPRSQALHALMAPLLAPNRPIAHVAVALMHQIHASFAYASGSTSIDTPIEAVLASRRGVCQDFAHVMIGALRMHGLPARYVSGYLLTRPAPGRAKMVGADASHAWVAVWCPRQRGDAIWLELDPTNNVVGSTEHVRLAVGRDFGDVAPLRGIIRGGAGHRLTVRVHTELID